MLRVRAVFVGVISLVVIIKRQHFILPVSSRKNIVCVTIVSLVELFEETKAFRYVVIKSRIEIKIQSPC